MSIDWKELDEAIRRMIVLAEWQKDLDNYGGTWETTIEDANDGTGDGILTFPEGLVISQGWKEGTELNLTVVGTGVGKSLIISEVKNGETPTN